MVYVDFADPRSPPGQLSHQLGRDHRTLGLQVEPLQQFAPKKFKPTINIAYADAQQYSHQHRPRVAVDAPHQRVCTMHPSSDHDVVIRHSGRQAGDVESLELAVAIAQHDPWLAAGADTGNDRSAIAAIERM